MSSRSAAPRTDFLAHLRAALADGTFQRLVLGKPRSHQTLLKLTAEFVTTGDGPRLQLHFHHRERDLTQPADAAAVGAAFDQYLGPALGSAHLFATTTSWQLELNKKGEPRLSRAPAAPTAVPPPHDRLKVRPLAPADAPWLQPLGLAGGDGRIRAEATSKFRQISRYVELLLPLCREAGLAAPRPEPLRAFDLGAGKGYLTFAAWHALAQTLGRPVHFTGVEARPELAALCQSAARATHCEGLEFVASRIVDYPVAAADLFIALHACDTATDEALFRGLRAGAALIVAAPCCHKEVRPQLRPPPELAAVARHGVYAGRLAEMVTDTLRALLLEAQGYRVALFEFVETEHTPKNTMLAAVRRPAPDAAADTRARDEFAALKARFGIRHQHLETLLASPAP